MGRRGESLVRLGTGTGMLTQGETLLKRTGLAAGPLGGSDVVSAIMGWAQKACAIR